MKNKEIDFKKTMENMLKELKSFKGRIVIAIILAITSAVFSIVAPNNLANLTDKIAEGLVINTSNLAIITDKMQYSLENIDVRLLSNEEQMNLSKIDRNNKEELVSIIVSLEEEKLKEIFKPIIVDNKEINYQEQIVLLKEMDDIKKGDFNKIPTNVYEVIKPKMDLEVIKKLVIFLIVLYIVSSLFNYLEAIIMSNVSNNFARELRKKISLKINKLPLKYFDNKEIGDVLSRVTNDVDTLAQAMTQSSSTLVSALTLFMGTIIMMFVTNGILAITAIVSSLIGFIFMFKVLSKSQKYFTAIQEELGNLNGQIEEVYGGLIVVKANNGKKETDLEFDKRNKKVYEASKKSQFLSGLMHPMMYFVGNFGYVAVCIVGAILTSKELISFGIVVAFITYVRLFSNPLTQIAQALTSLQGGAAASGRVFEFLAEDEMSKQEEIKIHLAREEVKGNIEFKDIEFGYNKEQLVIKNFTANVLEGQKIAIVGPTGAGKTTMVNLLMKFYEINKGDIVIDGVSTKSLSRENIHSLFTMVLQDTWLFEGSIKDNIIFNRRNVSDKKVMEVCDVVGLTHFIKTLPQGIDTIVSENDAISSGQKQLITIARGMIEDAPFLILDEATSNVDTRTEENLQKAMDKLMEGKTSFIIAHRLSTIKNADLILVMRDGNIVEQGNHDSLIAKNGFYAEIYNAQFEL